MLTRLWAYLRNQLVADVPREIAACLDCGRITCAQQRFRSCPARLAQAAWPDQDASGGLRAARPAADPPEHGAGTA